MFLESSKEYIYIYILLMNEHNGDVSPEKYICVYKLVHDKVLFTN